MQETSKRSREAAIGKREIVMDTGFSYPYLYILTGKDLKTSRDDELGFINQDHGLILFMHAYKQIRYMISMLCYLFDYKSIWS